MTKVLEMPMWPLMLIIFEIVGITFISIAIKQRIFNQSTGTKRKSKVYIGANFMILGLITAPITFAFKLRILNLLKIVVFVILCLIAFFILLFLWLIGIMFIEWISDDKIRRGKNND